MNRHVPSFLFLITLIFSTTTVLAQWERQYPMEKLENVLSIAAHGDSYGYAVGDDALILKLDPNTQLWNPMFNWDMNWDLKAVDYVSGTNGAVVAAGGQGLILSTNGGTNWTAIAGAPANILSLQITSSTDILVVAVGGVFKWENAAWTDLNLPITFGVKDGFILDGDHLWVYNQGANATIYSTTDGGNNWSENTDIPGADVVTFFDTQYGIATDGRLIYQSLNGGTSWTLISTNEIHNNSQDIAFGENANVMLSATNNGQPSITQDSGRTWTKFDMGTINTKNYSVVAMSDTDFWVGNDVSSITRTINGGSSWAETSGPERNILYDTYFFDRNIGMSVGSEGAILRTFDGGTHWEKLDLIVPNACFSVYGISENDVWVGANKGIFHTTDMGDTWTEKLSLLGGSVNDIVALSASRILATTTTGFILISTDGGTSWDTSYTTSNQFRSITKIDEQRLMATGYSGLILKSIDQGDTWVIITPPVVNLQYEQTYFIGEEGWMVTSSFRKEMWHSLDAGDSWSVIDLPIERFWEGLYFVSPDTGIVVGKNNLEGRVYITFDGGQSWQGGHITSYPILGVTGFPNPNGTAWIYGFGSDIEVLPYCNAQPVIEDFTGELSPCEGDTVLYTISSQEVAQYFWIFPNGWVPISELNNDSVWVKIGQSGVVSVTGSNPCGISETINTSINPNALPTISTLIGEDSPCEGSSVTYSISGTSADQYVWSFPADWNVTTDPAAASVTVDVGVNSGEVSVIGLNDCGASETIMRNVTTILLPLLNNVTGELEPCQGTNATYTADAENSDLFIWSYPIDWEVMGNFEESTIQLKVGAIPGSVSVVGQNACGLSAEVSLSVTPKIAAEVTIIQNGNTLSLSQVGSSYQWYLNGEVIDLAFGSEYVVTVSGDYHAVVVYANGCESTTEAINVIVTSIWDAKDILEITTYPNPVKEEVFLQGIEGDFNYKIFDFTGSLVGQNSTTKQSISVGNLSEGVYVIRIKQNEKTYQARFVIMR